MRKLETDFPDKLHEAVLDLVRHGWFADEGELVREAVRRYLDSHSAPLMAQLIREDVEWGLRGKD